MGFLRQPILRLLVAFPFTNLQATKQRPAVIISDDAYQQNRPDVILMAITSRVGWVEARNPSAVLRTMDSASFATFSYRTLQPIKPPSC